MSQDIEDLDIQLEITDYRFPPESLKQGIYVTDDVNIIFTIANHGFDDFSVGEMLKIYQEADSFFKTNAIPLKGLEVPSMGRTDFTFTMQVKNEIRNLNTLPQFVTISIINRKREVKASAKITVPIDLYVLGLKRRYTPINVFLFGQVGMGKSSFINTVATVLNQNRDFKHKVISITPAGKSTISLTRCLQSHTFGNLRIFDTWGWEKTDDSVNSGYSKDFFRLILQGLVPENIDLESVKDYDVSDNNPDVCPDKNKIDVVIFFVTPSSTSEEYLTKVREFQGVCGSLRVKTMVLLTQIDILDVEFEKDPYSKPEKIVDLLDKISNDTSLNQNDIKPIVNYVRNDERTWALDRACFVPISHCFSLNQDTDYVEQKK